MHIFVITEEIFMMLGRVVAVTTVLDFVARIFEYWIKVYVDVSVQNG